MKKTKVIATIGPASQDKETIKNMILSGMDIARVNMSHSSHDFLSYVVKTIQEINQECDKNVSVMLDTNGPSVQIGPISGGQAYFQEGDKVRIYVDPIMGNNTRLSVSYPKLIEEVKIGTLLKMNDGLVELEVEEKEHDCLICHVNTGGLVLEEKKMNVIGVELNIPFLTEKDKEDILFASELHVDYLALSFVSNHEDVLEVNDLLINGNDSHMTVISKIENASAIEDLEEIIKVSDGVMIARGDLGVELPFERIPGLQKQIINECHRLGKVSVVATEMLSSMEEEIRPTRAEVSDVANAVLEGVDAVMLTGETTMGRHPVEVLSMMSKIVETSEEDMDYQEFFDRSFQTEKQDTTGSIAFSVVDCARRLKATCIVAPTMSGYTARKLSRFRPTCPIIAMSPDRDTVKSLNIYYGVYPVWIPDTKSFDKMMEEAKKQAISLFHLEEGERIIITGGYPFTEVKHTNFMKIEDL